MAGGMRRREVDVTVYVPAETFSDTQDLLFPWQITARCSKELVYGIEKSRLGARDEGFFKGRQCCQQSCFIECTENIYIFYAVNIMYVSALTDTLEVYSVLITTIQEPKIIHMPSSVSTVTDSSVSEFILSREKTINSLCFLLADSRLSLEGQKPRLSSSSPLRIGGVGRDPPRGGVVIVMRTGRH